jgi:UDP-N-acetylglucosamine--dolichyl-phosphate N-acetylglucosaminephosphotransferase
MIPLSELDWNFIEIMYLIIIFVVGFLVTYIILPYIINLMKKKNYVGYDIHKNSRPEVAESGGLGFVFGFVVSSIFLMVFFPNIINEITIFLITVLLAALIGFIDDRIKLRSLFKIILSIFSGTVIFFANQYGYIDIPSPTFPFLSQTRLTIIYPYLIPLLVAIFVNTVNMLEGYNGEGSGTSLISVCFLFICAIISNSAQGVIFSIPVIAVLIPFFLKNKYPAKIFPGDIGTLSMGAMIACIMLFGSLEVATFCALLIHIFNSFYVIYSVKGFLESDKIREGKDDIILLENDEIKASDKKDAALTLPRLILARGSLKEPQLVKNFFVISVICGIFAILSVVFTQITLGVLAIYVFLIVFIFLMAPVIYFLKKFPRIRGVIMLMMILLIAAIVFFFLVEIIIILIPFNIELGVIRIPVNLIIILLLGIIGLLGWYYITIKYFWIQIDKMKNKDVSKA